MRAALYLRVSTIDQTTENQRLELDKLCDFKGWEITQTYEDHGISGSKGRQARKGLDDLLKDATRGRFDIALFWSVDRLGRSTAQVTAAMEELKQAGVKQYYMKEAIDTSTPHGEAMIEMAAVFAKLERSMIVERVKAGLERAKAQGKTLGRRKVSKAKEQRVLELRKQGLSYHKIAKEAQVGVSVVQRVLKAIT